MVPYTPHKGAPCTTPQRTIFQQIAKPLEAIYHPIQHELAQVETTLRTELQGVDGFLGEVTRYVSEQMGKRLRPALALLSARACRGLPEGRRRQDAAEMMRRVVLMASAVELIHTATLVHDDVIDAATLRRGKPTVNAVWGNTLSVLAGDYLYSQAFCLLSALEAPAVLQLMSQTSQRVCVGEVAQVRHQGDVALSERDYLAMIQEKTASLMAAACQGAALLVGAPDEVVQALAGFGQPFGMAFQILDDTHDLLGDEARLGKSLGTDLAHGTLTLPMIVLREAVDTTTRETVCDLLRPAGEPPHNGETARMLQALAVTHNVATLCVAKAQAFVTQARAAAERLPPSDARQGLVELTDYILAA